MHLTIFIMWTWMYTMKLEIPNGQSCRIAHEHAQYPQKNHQPTTKLKLVAGEYRQNMACRSEWCWTTTMLSITYSLQVIHNQSWSNLIIQPFSTLINPYQPASAVVNHGDGYWQRWLCYWLHQLPTMALTDQAEAVVKPMVAQMGNLRNQL